MGYTTAFEGSLTITPELTPEDWAYYYVHYRGRTKGREYPLTPDSYCDWVVPHEARDTFRWDGSEKFYNWGDWIRYLIAEFFAPRGYALNGEMKWRGKDALDVGRITVKNNHLDLKTGHVPDSTPLTTEEIEKLLKAVRLAEDEQSGYEGIPEKLTALLPAQAD